MEDADIRDRRSTSLCMHLNTKKPQRSIPDTFLPPMVSASSPTAILVGSPIGNVEPAVPSVEISVRRDTNLVLNKEENRELWQWHTKKIS